MPVLDDKSSSPRMASSAASSPQETSPRKAARGKTLLPVIAEAGDTRLCPSYSPREPGSGWVFGVVEPTEEGPRMVPLDKPEAVTEAVFQMASPLHPGELFRITAPCMGAPCKNHGEGGICHLARSVAKRPIPKVSKGLPPCTIRASCLWWDQEGRDACDRCTAFTTTTNTTLAAIQGKGADD